MHSLAFRRSGGEYLNLILPQGNDQKSESFSKYLRQEFQLSRFPFEGSHQMSRDSTPGIKDGFFRFSRPDYSPFQQTCQSHENFAIFQRRREVGLTKFNRGLFKSTIIKLVSEG